LAGPDDDLEDEERGDKDDAVALPLDFEDALRALLAVDPRDAEDEAEN
jgi:hypothetical protein